MMPKDLYKNNKALEGFLYCKYSHGFIGSAENHDFICDWIYSKVQT